MDYIVIDVPDMNDSVSRIELSGKQFQIRFCYNDTGDYWMFSVYDSQGEPIYRGVKVVPNFPINMYLDLQRGPYGVFAVDTELDHVGRQDFAHGKAQFVFLPL